MTRILLFFTIVVSLASAALAYMTKVKGIDLTSKMANITENVGLLKNDNSKLKQEKKTLETKMEEVETAIKDQKQEAEKLKAAIAAKQAEVAKAQSELAAAKGDVDELKKKLEEKPAAPVAQAPDPFMEQTLATMRSELEKARQDLDEEKKTSEQKIKQAQAKASELAMKAKSSDAPKTEQQKKAIRGQVVAYNEGWNFVVANLGDKQGVTPESKLLVVRDGKPLARLEITDVQPKFVTAGLVSLTPSPKGFTFEKIRVRPGDVVEFAPSEPEESPVGQAGLSANILPSRISEIPVP